MNIKLQEAVSLYFEINGMTKTEGDKQVVILQGIMKQKMSLKTKVYLQRLNKIVTEEFNVYQKENNELLKKYGNESDGVITIDNENLALYKNELDNLLGTNVVIDINNLWSNDLTIDNLSAIETDEYYPVLCNLLDSNEK